MNKTFILLLLFSSFTLRAQVGLGVVTPPKSNVRSSESASLKAGKYVDKSGDTITVLDYVTREKIKNSKSIKATSVFDNEAEIEKYKSDYEKNILADRDLKFGVYVAVAGDTLKIISQKLYGTPKRWSEIQVLNENILQSEVVNAGMKLKYQIEPKEKRNER